MFYLHLLFFMIQCPFMRYLLLFFFCVSCSSSHKTPEFSWPADSREISRHFSGSHDGMDIVVPVNSNVYSVHNGYVFLTGNSITYGKYIILEFSNQWGALYAHLNKLLIKKGDLVKSKQKIALSGSTGQSASPHLHFELFKNKKSVNPAKYLNP